MSRIDLIKKFQNEDAETFNKISKGYSMGRKDGIRHFAEWLTKSDYANGYFDTENGFVSVDTVIAKYDMEYENDN